MPSDVRWKLSRRRSRCAKASSRHQPSRVVGSSAVVRQIRSEPAQADDWDPRGAGAESPASTNRSRLSKPDSQHEALGCCTPRFACLGSTSYPGRSTGPLYEVLGAWCSVLSTSSDALDRRTSSVAPVRRDDLSKVADSGRSCAIGPVPTHASRRSSTSPPFSHQLKSADR